MNGIPDFNLSSRVNAIEDRVKIIEQQVSSIHTQIDQIPEKLNKLFIVERNRPVILPKMKHCYEEPSRVGTFILLLSATILIAYYLGMSHIG